MKRILLVFTLTLLTGCPGENGGVGSWRSYAIINDTLCFSVDKKDTLSRYSVHSMQGEDYKTIAEKDYAVLHYPDSCIRATLTKGYVYETSYTLNGKNYRYNFFIDDNDQLFSTSGGG
ncbi:putative T6SS immunity periplasmic lipoprotein [Enterobacteriaceae bacterium C23F]